MIVLTMSRTLTSDRCPATDRTIFLSAVKILLGRIKLSIGRLPEIKSFASRGNEKGSVPDFLLVIWHTIISSPGKSAITKAGRFFYQSDR